MNDLAECVNASIGAPCAYRVDRLTGNARKGAFQVILNAATGELSLPAAKSRAVVLDPQSYSHACHRAGPQKKNRGS
jgi:hypothetical protein